MTKMARTLALLVLASAAGVWATPAAAEQANPTANAVCTEDVICVDAGTVATWPLDRWTTVRRANRQAGSAR